MSSLVMGVVTDFARGLEEKQRAHRLAKSSKLWRPTATPATDLGHQCNRRIALHRLKPEDAQPIGEELAGIFEEGKMHEKNVRRELSDLGFEVVGAEENYRDERLEISGTIDGKLEIPVDDAMAERAKSLGCEVRFGGLRVPAEIKSTMARAPSTQEHWRNHDNAMMRRWHAQLTGYMILTSNPFGLGLFKNKVTGLWTVCPIELDYSYAEGLLRRAEIVRDAVAAYRADPSDKLLPPHLGDRSECGTCPWRDRACYPSDVAIDPLLLIDDDELRNQLNRRGHLDPLRKEFADIDKAIKTRFKHTAGDQWVIGTADDGWSITRKISKSGSHLFKFKRLAVTTTAAGEE